MLKRSGATTRITSGADMPSHLVSGYRLIAGKLLSLSTRPGISTASGQSFVERHALEQIVDAHMDRRTGLLSSSAAPQRSLG
jgi:hypothetical protein